MPPGLAGWSPAVPVSAASTPVTLPIGQGVRATLLPVASVKLAVATDRSTAGTSAGVFAFTVRQPGRYRVALGAGVWIDVVGGGRALPAVAHGHGPACSPVRKMVDFDLGPGAYRLQVVGSAAPVVDLMIARLP